MNLQELLKQKEEMANNIDALMGPVRMAQEAAQRIEEQITAIIMEPVRQARLMSGKDTGTVDVLIAGVMVKHQVSKVVKWDQAKLATLRDMIRQHNDDPDQYMKTKTEYRIDEKAYIEFPEPIKKVFADAREVKAGPPKITFDVNWR